MQDGRAGGLGGPVQRLLFAAAPRPPLYVFLFARSSLLWHRGGGTIFLACLMDENPFPHCFFLWPSFLGAQCGAASLGHWPRRGLCSLQLLFPEFDSTLLRPRALYLALFFYKLDRFFIFTAVPVNSTRPLGRASVQTGPNSGPTPLERVAARVALPPRGQVG